MGFFSTAAAFDLVQNGKAVCTIVVADPENDEWSKTDGPSDGYSAGVLADWIEKISGAKPRISDKVPQEGFSIFVGKSAVDAGLKLADIESPSQEGMRIQCDGKRLLVAGQSPVATLKATCRLLEELGCRYLIDHPLGEVYPKSKTLSVPNDLNISDSPGLAMRRIWGSVWSSNNLWKVWNGSSGFNFPTGHAWKSYVDKSAFEDHPEWFALRDGERRRGSWYCTSNEQLRDAFAEGVVAKLNQNGPHASISPPDGRGYCECDACRAQDDPHNIEPSSGTVSISNRYADFYDGIAKRVAKKHPGALLNFYCYADYTQAPSSSIDLEDSLVAWIAPIRYCRYHHIGAKNCPSRHQLASLIDGWSASANQLGYRTYNFNLASSLVPFSKVQIWAHDIPFLKKKRRCGDQFGDLSELADLWSAHLPEHSSCL